MLSKSRTTNIPISECRVPFELRVSDFERPRFFNFANASFELKIQRSSTSSTFRVVSPIEAKISLTLITHDDILNVVNDGKGGGLLASIPNEKLRFIPDSIPDFVASVFKNAVASKRESEEYVQCYVSVGMIC
jgi:hypothetical protein